MIRKILIVVVLFLAVMNSSFAQVKKEEKFEVYNPKAVPVEDLAKAVQQAMMQNKHVMIQIGGNWCKWCRVFYNFTKSDHEIDSVMNANYVVMHVNYSKENKNLPFLETMEFPQRFGYPVFVILNVSGQRIHTQSSWYLEDGNKKKDGYDREKVMAFLKDWSPAVLDPKNYEDEKK
ncbi:MAG: thioredoxin family protein [Bacteroidia bacterium]